MDTRRPRGCMGQVYEKTLPRLQRLIGDRGDDLESAVEGTWWGGSTIRGFFDEIWGWRGERFKKNIRFPVKS